MDIPESRVHSFIIKVWLEDDETGRTVWHGYITHVPDGGRHYLQNLRDILNFVEPYVEEAGGVMQGSPGRCWLKPWARRKQ